MTDCAFGAFNLADAKRFPGQTNLIEWLTFVGGFAVPNRLDARIQQRHTCCNQSKKQSIAALTAADGWPSQYSQEATTS